MQRPNFFALKLLGAHSSRGPNFSDTKFLGAQKSKGYK